VLAPSLELVRRTVATEAAYTLSRLQVQFVRAVWTAL
jgi:hypothetical protein